MTLDEIALSYATDKASNLHNYTEKYERYFAALRQEKLKVLEIGIQNGYSLKTWKQYFPFAEIFGIDIVDCKHMDEERIKTLKGSQTDITFLNEINTTYGPFDIIIDDGSHFSTDMTISFNTLFPQLKSGGLYIVEDLHCLYWPQFRDGGKSFMKRLSKLMNSVNGRGKWGLADKKNEKEDSLFQKKRFGKPDWWDRNVEYIHLYRSIVFIRKYENGDSFGPSSRKKLQWYPKLWRLMNGALRKIKNKS